MRFIEKLKALPAGLCMLLAACGTSDAPRPAPPAASPPGVPAAPVGKARNWDEYKLQAAHKLVQANGDRIYLGEVPEPLLAIPVLEVELNRDGSIHKMSVQRMPGQATDTVQLAMDAVRRAAPFGDVGHLPRPWKYSEVFLFRNDRKFKPRMLDQ